VNAFFGGPPAAVLVRLAIISLLVGFILSAMGLNPLDIVNSLVRFVRHIYEMGFDAIEWIFRYFLLGAVIVVPIWFITRLWKTMSRPSGSPSRRDA
jgi:hypothetical protein